MQQRRHQDGPREQGASTVEYIGCVVAVAALLGGVASAFGEGTGRTLASAVPERIEQLLAGGERRTAHEQRRGGGTVPARVARDDLRMNPLVPTVGVWERTLDRSARARGVDAHVSGQACALCVSIGTRHAASSGLIVDSAGKATGVQANLKADARFALFAAEVGTRLQRDIGFGGQLTAQARVRGLVGAETTGRANLKLGRTEQRLDVGGTAMAGASARAEGRAGLDLFGVAIRQSGSAEGWAGAGVRGEVKVEHSGSSLSWKTGWGAALGLGGALSWGGTVDVSGVPASHRALGQAVLSAALVQSLPGQLLGNNLRPLIGVMR
jgi:hypothetical protein